MTKNYLLFRPKVEDYNSSQIVNKIIEGHVVRSSPGIVFNTPTIHGKSCSFSCKANRDSYSIIVGKLKSREFIIIINPAFNLLKALIQKNDRRIFPPSFDELKTVFENAVLNDIQSTSLRWLTEAEANFIK